MWDVIWTDPDKELVGEHRAKKEKDENRRKRTPDSRSGRASVCTTSSSKSSIDTPFTFFRGRGLKRITNPNGMSGQMASSSSASSGPESPTVRSPLSRTFDDSSRPSSDRASASIFERHVDSPSSASPISRKFAESLGNVSRSTSNNESLFSAATADSTTTTTLEDEPMTESEKIRSIIQMLKEVIPTSSEPIDSASRGVETPSIKRTVSQGPLTPPQSPTTKLPSHGGADLTGSPTTVLRPLKSLLRVSAPRWCAPVMPNNLDAWKPPNQWDSEMVVKNRWSSEPFELLKKSPERLETSPEIVHQERSQERFGSLQDGNAAAWTPTCLRQEALKMASTRAKDTLSRLYELWAKTQNMSLRQFWRGDTSDEVVEMRRWMLSTMNRRDQSPLDSSMTSPRESPTTGNMILVLYETPITATYLAAAHPSKQFYHMSTTKPIKVDRHDFPNIHSIQVPPRSWTGEFPVAPGLFESVYSLTLPSTCPATALPSVLAQVEKSLKPGGAVHLTLVDPLPRAGTMGPRMRAWLEGNLLHPLARSARCMSPSTTFPAILGDVGLRGKGSTLTTTKFYACPQSVALESHEDDGGDGGSCVKAEVRSLVGRTLWGEVWGGYVRGDGWWWEEEACVRECLEMGTFWEYHVIKGVKPC